MVNDRSFRASSSALVNNPPAAAQSSNSGGSGGMSGMLPSFLGGGNSSQTATEPRPGNSSGSTRSTEEESKSGASAFTAFKGKGVSLGSDLPKSTQSTLNGSRSSSSSAAASRPPARPHYIPTANGVQTVASNYMPTETTNQTTEIDEDSNSQEDEEGALKKSKDTKGDYKPVN